MNALQYDATCSNESIAERTQRGRPLRHRVAGAERRGLAAGDVVAGKYEVLGRLGAGGMGVVWRARSFALDLDVALKVLHRESDDEVAVARLRREAQATARLAHPAIVRIFDVGETEAGEPFLVMELVAGESLGAWLDRRGRVPAEEAVPMLLQVAAGLAAAHAQGVVHRDVKPDNILVATGPDGLPVLKVVDFGIAKLVTRSGPVLTAEGTVIGSLQYMPPEQAAGREVDEQADVWALCVVLYELITGRRPFEGTTLASVLVALHTHLPTPTTELAAGDAELWTILAHGLKKSRAARFHSMRALGEALASWALARGVITHAMEAWPQPMRLRPSRESDPEQRPVDAPASEPAATGPVAPEPRAEALRRPRRRTRGALIALVAASIALGLSGVCAGGWTRPVPDQGAAIPAPAAQLASRAAPTTTAVPALEAPGAATLGASAATTVPRGQTRDGRTARMGTRKVSSATMPLPRSPDF